MTLELSKQFHDILNENLIKNENPIFLIIDDTTDVGDNHYKIVYFQTIEDTHPAIYSYKPIETKSKSGISGFKTLRITADAF